MAKDRNFLDTKRVDAVYRPVAERLKDYNEVEVHPALDVLKEQASRCMSCGIPFCHGMGCPLKNVIPEINRAAMEERFEDAWALLSNTSSFPEFTSRICPALCEGACTAGLDLEPVTIRQLEYLVTEEAFKRGYVQPHAPVSRNGKKVAVVGAGPSGLAAAARLNSMGYMVTVYEKSAKIGGLLRYGIPDFKLAKSVIDRRLQLMVDEGIEFVVNADIGKDISLEYLKRHYDAIVLAMGTPNARDLAIPGRELEGIYLALQFLGRQNRIVSGEESPDEAQELSASGKEVVVIGGGDTGSDCVGTALRQGATKVTQIEIMPKPPEKRSPSTPWPMWPYMLRTSSSHKEGCEREWSIATKSFAGEDGQVKAIQAVRVEWEFSPDGRPLRFTEIPGSQFEIKADMVLLAMGFVGFKAEDFSGRFNVSLTERGWVKCSCAGVTEQNGVFAAGDTVSGPSLVVRAIASGRAVADAVDNYLGGGEK